MTDTSREAVDRLLHDTIVRAALADLEQLATSPLVPNWARRIISWAAEVRACLLELLEEREDAWLAAKIEAGDSNDWRARATKAEAALEAVLEHLPENWGDQVVDGELMLRVEAAAIDAARGKK